MANDYNPDVLNCIANLSNDEVFTSPALANNMLDILPPDLFQSKETTFLDPFCKSGVFLREIVKRLDSGLKEQIPDCQQRIDHILHHQVFGIAITELTALLSRRSLYCSKYANSKYSISYFDDAQGNVLYTTMQHTWQGGKCRFCGASQAVYDRDDAAETYAYQFIHTNNPEKIFNMTFDVIIGNPPYQMNDGGGIGSSAMPIYQKFIQQSKKLNPRYLCMIVPSRWFVGGKGLDDFREEMLNDSRLRIIHDYLNASDCFPRVEIKGGVCYFLWERDNKGLCKIFTHENNVISSKCERPLLEKNSDVLIRFNQSIPIFRKVVNSKFKSFIDLVSTRKPFGISSTFIDYHSNQTCDNSIMIYANKTIGYLDKSFNFSQNKNWVNKYKVYISFGYGAGEGYPHQIINKPILGSPNSCCTETY
jgi:site-specific DNA-methyltransferase (adenine-specific)